MLFPLPFSKLSLSASILSTLLFNAAAQTASSLNCTEFFVPVNISTQTSKLNVTAPSSQAEMTGLITRMTWANSSITNDVNLGTTALNATYKIWSQLCVPDGFGANGTLEFTIHGGTENHTYFSLGKDSPFNYAQAAVQAGHAILTYDNLGAGKSDKPDGIQEVQISTETAVGIALVEQLPSVLKFGKLVGVGHAHGSVIMMQMLAQRGNLFDATVLTSIASSTLGATTGIAAMNLQIASESAPEFHEGLSSAYTVSGGWTSDQTTFYHFPFFDADVLDDLHRGREVMALGMLLTLPENRPALNYTNSVLAVTGDRDYFMCAGNCNVTTNGFDSAPAAVAGLFPAAKDFTTHIPENTGHFLNYHHSAPQTFEFIQNWISGAL
ncbi:hypothetical protein K435DRAFT_863073 [Dendrothele bispora CBS 962.96]|uniref:AB hydrolase-1 domain-containing protein n=1 Tax=Dendrothele bispora (strain CBS 962.96) TaxID=1314807 RepID=A0A4S8LQY1_DENBC|nr:hypothetical protein K435DRAFT_863073 [Dendrothele bispora CBS 962.96]